MPATLARFLFGLPFAAVYLLALYALLPGTHVLPSFSAAYFGWIVLGAASQIAAAAALLLAVAMSLIMFGARRLGFDRADEIAIVFCGSKKSLATGVPMAKVMFAGGSLGAIVLPVMLYHQIQLIACSFVAQHYVRTRPADAAGTGKR